VIGLVKTTALEVADAGITVNAVCPAAVGTDLFFNQPMDDLFCPDMPRPVSQEQFLQRLDDLKVGLNGVRYLEASDVTRAVMYLVLDRG
jgi:NAD(P)-dependent dehydrogenase (short-subunit alcohol dehydrogenase family)